MFVLDTVCERLTNAHLGIAGPLQGPARIGLLLCSLGLRQLRGLCAVSTLVFQILHSSFTHALTVAPVLAASVNHSSNYHVSFCRINHRMGTAERLSQSVNDRQVRDASDFCAKHTHVSSPSARRQWGYYHRYYGNKRLLCAYFLESYGM